MISFQMEMGFHISCVESALQVAVVTPSVCIARVNGCSLKTQQNLEAAMTIWPERIMFETGKSPCERIVEHPKLTPCVGHRCAVVHPHLHACVESPHGITPASASCSVFPTCQTART